MLGKEAALFFPSGVMANQAAIWIHAPRGTEVLLDVDAHIVHSEIAATAVLSGAQVQPVVPTGRDDERRRFAPHLRPASRYFPAPSLVCVENTHNGAGGNDHAMSPSCARFGRWRRSAGFPSTWTARASGTRASRAASRCRRSREQADTVMVAFSKGLGAPVGAALAGTRAAMETAWTARKLFGGAMRQSGILAAAALHGVDHHIDRLADDHANARALAGSIDGAGGATVVPPDTNIVMIDLPSGLAAAGVVAPRRSAWRAGRRVDRQHESVW